MPFSSQLFYRFPINPVLIPSRGGGGGAGVCSQSKAGNWGENTKFYDHLISFSNWGWIGLME